MDYTYRNKACPKDSFALPKIDRLVDSTVGHALLSFMDAYSVFHQIPMWPEDQDKTSFIIEIGSYGWLRMPMFDLAFKPIKAIKGQTLADFIVELTRLTVESVQDAARGRRHWTLMVDGSSTVNGCRLV